MTLAAFMLLVQVTAQVLSVYDGDTIRVQAEVWPGMTWSGSVRVDGVDTPEIRGRCEKEIRMAIAARDFVREKAGEKIALLNVKRGKYAGRVIADVQLANGKDLAQALIEAGLGRPYDGGARKSWCGN